MVYILIVLTAIYFQIYAVYAGTNEHEVSPDKKFSIYSNKIKNCTSIFFKESNKYLLNLDFYVELQKPFAESAKYYIDKYLKLYILA